jgi:hypothetical protein
MNGFTDVFDECEKNYIDTFVDFSKFREDHKTWWFILGNTLLDFNALSISNEINPELFSRYLNIPKSKLGYTENVEYKFIDVNDSRHIMMSTIIFSHKNDFENIVEIGAGYGNWYRLNQTIANHNTWTMIDLPFVSNLQKWYLENEVSDLSKARFLTNSDQLSDKIDLVIGAHSISELSWENFDHYYSNVIVKSEYFFYAGHRFNCGEDLLTMKLQRIAEDFDLIVSIMTEDNSVYNNLYKKKIS